MSATILKFPHAARASTAPPAEAQPLAPASATHGAGALSPAQELYMDAYLERGIDGCWEQLNRATTEEAQHYWLKCMKRLCGLRVARRIAAVERAQQPR